MAKKTNAPADGRRFRTTVPEGHLKKIIDAERAYSALVQKNRIRYPEPDKLDQLTHKALKKYGFIDFGKSLKDLLGLTPKDVKGKNKGKGGGKGGGKKLPDPNVVLSEVQASLAAAKIGPVTGTGDVVAIEWNMEFLDETKAKFFAAVYKEIFQCCDVAYLAEVSAKGMAELGKITGYIAFCSPENTRGQAVGFLVNPARFDVLGSPQVWQDIASVQGIPDLRPGFVIETQDKASKKPKLRKKRVVNHFKSMRGGPKVTEPVRYQQFQLLAKRMGTPVAGCKTRIGKYRLLQTFKNVKIGRSLSDHAVLFVTEKDDVNAVDGQWSCAGDFNDFIERNTHVTAPLTGAGYKLVYPTDNTSTQSMGGRLDGFFRDVSSGTTCGDAGSGPFADDATDPPGVTQ